jgi:hypothetical protein
MTVADVTGWRPWLTPSTKPGRLAEGPGGGEQHVELGCRLIAI